MHQPLTVAHEERVRLVNGEIIHLLLRFFYFDWLNFARRAICLADVIAELQVFGVRPACPFNIEGMLGGSLKFLAVNCEADDGLVRVVDGVCDGVETDRVGFFVPCKDVVPDFDLASLSHRMRQFAVGKSLYLRVLSWEICFHAFAYISYKQIV